MTQHSSREPFLRLISNDDNLHRHIEHFQLGRFTPSEVFAHPKPNYGSVFHDSPVSVVYFMYRSLETEEVDRRYGWSFGFLRCPHPRCVSVFVSTLDRPPPVSRFTLNSFPPPRDESLRRGMPHQLFTCLAGFPVSSEAEDRNRSGLKSPFLLSILTTPSPSDVSCDFTSIPHPRDTVLFTLFTTR